MLCPNVVHIFLIGSKPAQHLSPSSRTPAVSGQPLPARQPARPGPLYNGLGVLLGVMQSPGSVQTLLLPSFPCVSSYCPCPPLDDTPPPRNPRAVCPGRLVLALVRGGGRRTSSPHPTAAPSPRGHGPAAAPPPAPSPSPSVPSRLCAGAGSHPTSSNHRQRAPVGLLFPPCRSSGAPAARCEQSSPAATHKTERSGRSHHSGVRVCVCGALVPVPTPAALQPTVRPHRISNSRCGCWFFSACQ